MSEVQKATEEKKIKIGLASVTDMLEVTLALGGIINTECNQKIWVHKHNLSTVFETVSTTIF